MSLNDHKGSAYYFAELMKQSAAEIASGERKGATVLHKTANPAKVCIGWFKRRSIRGEFRKRA